MCCHNICDSFESSELGSRFPCSFSVERVRRAYPELASPHLLLFFSHRRPRWAQHFVWSFKFKLEFQFENIHNIENLVETAKNVVLFNVIVLLFFMSVSYNIWFCSDRILKSAWKFRSINVAKNEVEKSWLCMK